MTTTVKRFRAQHPAGGGSMDSYVDMEPKTKIGRITSPFTYLRSRKHSGDSKTLISSRSLESFDSVKVPVDPKTLPPVPRLPRDANANWDVPLSSGSEYRTSSSAQSSATFSPPPDWQSRESRPHRFLAIQHSEPAIYENDTPLQPVRRTTDPPAGLPRWPGANKNHSAQPSHVPWSPAEETMDKELDRHGANIVNSSNLLDKNIAEGLLISDALKSKNREKNAKRAAKIGKMIATGAEHLDKAQGLIEAAASSEVWKTGKEAAETLLQPCKELLPILDVVSECVPVLIVAKSVFSAIVKVELDRRDNDKNVGIVYVTMTNFMFTLCDLEIILHASEELERAIGQFMDGACQTINDFGNFREVYYKHGHMARVVRSETFKNQLADFTQQFKDLKDRLQEILTQHTSLTVMKMNQTVNDINAKFDMVLAAINARTPFEDRVMSRIQEVGGEEKAIQNTKLLTELAENYFHEQLTPQVKTALRTELSSLLQSNFAMYELKLEATKQSINKAVERSSDKILQHLESGPHNLIKDDDIRELWKNMVLEIYASTRHFVDAVHQHFAQKYSKYRSENGEPHAEEWTLKFVGKVMFQPTIGDAIDEDGTGYISVHEVNHFFNARPEEWSNAAWLSFCADGWYQNNIFYRDRCMALLKSIEASARKVLPHNRKAFKPYMKKGCLPELWVIVNSLNTDGIRYRGDQDYSALDPLRRKIMDAEIKKIETNLTATKYQLDTPDGVCAVMGTSRIEASVLCLLTLLLERHSKILELAERYVLSKREFETMVTSIHNVAFAFGMRYSNLTEGWRQQRQDINLQVQCFASGIFESWHQQFSEVPYDVEYHLNSPSYNGSLRGGYFDLQRGSSSDDQSGKPSRAESLLLFPLPQQPPPEEVRRYRSRQAEKTRRPLPEPPKPNPRVSRMKTRARNSRSGLHASPRTPTKTTPTRTHGFEWPDPVSQRQLSPAMARTNFYQFDEEAHEHYLSAESSDIPEILVSHTKSRIPKLEDRIRFVETELSSMKDMLSQLLTLSQKEKGLRIEVPPAPTVAIIPPQ